MLGKCCLHFPSFCEFEIGEVEAGGYTTTYQRIAPGLVHRGRKPTVAGNHQLEDFAYFGIGADEEGFQRAIRMDDVHRDSRSGVEMPDFVGLDAVKCRKVFVLDEEVDAGCVAAGTAVARRETILRDGFIASIYFFEISSLGMRSHVEVVDPIGF